MTRVATAALLAAMLTHASIAAARTTGESAEWDEAYIDSLYGGRITAPIEGVWQFPDDGATIAVARATESTYDIYLLDSPRLDIKPGVRIGKAVDAPKDGYYDAHMDAKAIGRKAGDMNATITVNNNGTLTIKPYKKGLSMTARHWFDVFLRVSVTYKDQRPKDLDGARKVYPAVMRTPVSL